jgi:hypothetical protein
MTNTLHRYGASPSFNDDYIVFAICCRGKNEKDALPRLKKFLHMAIPFQPVNLGDARNGGCLRPSASLNPTNHWNRDMKPDLERVANGLDAPTTVAAVFDNRKAAVDFIAKVKAENLGLSINVSTSVDNAVACCDETGLVRHSVGYSLGFEGKTEKLPNTQTLTLSTMCGHGMVSHSLAKKMIDWVKEGRRTPEEAVTYLARFCSCGVFNPSRARRILEDARHSMK